MSNELTDKEFNTLRDYLRDHYGISLNDEKKGLVYSRLRTHVTDLGLSSYTEYYKYLTNDKTGKEAQFFINALSTNHTFFMREQDHFDYFRDTALPWLEGAVKDKDLRLWCPASSSGEEPYTIQMILHDYFRNKPGWNLQTLATDISEKVLDKAVLGVYSNESLSALPERWIKQYFIKHDAESMRISEDIRKNVTYRKFNLMDERFPFRRPFQIIFCRNVMIYFDAETRDALVERFYNHMIDGGYLFIGHAESLNHTGTRFKYVMPAIYRK